MARGALTSAHPRRMIAGDEYRRSALEAPVRTLSHGIRSRVAVAAAAVLVASLAWAVPPAHAAAADLALGAVATATSMENAGLGPDKAVDGDPTTRWSSA